MVSPKQVAQSLGQFGKMLHFPTEQRRIAEIASILLLCETDAEAVELTVYLHAVSFGEWPGTRELRRLYMDRIARFRLEPRE